MSLLHSIEISCANDVVSLHQQPQDFCDGEERAGCFTLFVFLLSCDCCVALSHNAIGLSAAVDCVIS